MSFQKISCPVVWHAAPLEGSHGILLKGLSSFGILMRLVENTVQQVGPKSPAGQRCGDCSGSSTGFLEFSHSLNRLVTPAHVVWRLFFFFFHPLVPSLSFLVASWFYTVCVTWDANRTDTLLIVIKTAAYTGSITIFSHALCADNQSQLPRILCKWSSSSNCS